MPYCEYDKCKRVADVTQCGLLRKWSSWHFRDFPTHTQDIALCDKHLKKINKLLHVRSTNEESKDE